MAWKSKCGWHLRWLAILLQIILLAQCVASRWQGIHKNESDGEEYYPPVEHHVVLDNGTLSTPEGMVTGITYDGIDNLIEHDYQDGHRGYWDLVWSKPDHPNDKIAGSNLVVTREDDEQVELSFVRTSSPSEALGINKRGMVVDDRMQADPSPVHLVERDGHVVMSNGIVSITLTVPGGSVTSVTYKGSDNLLLIQDKETDRGHWNVDWNKVAGDGDNIDNLEGTSFKVILENENQTEISFTRTWDSTSSLAPLNIDKRYVMLRGSPGFYSYAVLERLKGWPSFSIQEGRIVFKLHSKKYSLVSFEMSKFHYMAMSDERQGLVPTFHDRQSGTQLAYKEAVYLSNPSNPAFKGEVDDKYLYSCDNKDSKVHGWVSNDPEPIGFWLITPSNEFRTGGPLKQDLTSHVGPFTLSMFISRHYVGEDIDVKFEIQDYWKKVIGPIYIYLNSDASTPSILWNDAKLRMQEEVASWPYDFLCSEEFLKSAQRGSLNGQFFVHDRFIDENMVPAASAYVGLAPSGPAGSWQIENKGYQFWTETDNEGHFMIKNVIPGTYSLFAWVPGVVGDYKHVSDINITPGSNVTVENVVFDPPRNGATLWEIGIPDRSAAEFFIPDPKPRFKIHPFALPVEKFRQYGLWECYADKYPNEDLIFKIGTSNYTKDWFFAHVTRNVGHDEYAATTWQILFDMKTVNKDANYTLQLALASTHAANLHVHFNNQESRPDFETGTKGKDNAIARHGIRGLYHFYSFMVSGQRLLLGENKLFLTQVNKSGLFAGLMYDYIRFEQPNPSTSLI